MTPQVSDFIPGSLEDRDKNIEVADRHHVIAKKKGQVQIKMCDDNGYPFIATLHNVLLATDLCNILFSIIMLMNLGHTCLFQKGFALCTSEQKRKMQLHYHIIHKGNMYFCGKSRKCQRHINYYIKRKLVQNYCIKDQVTIGKNNSDQEIYACMARISGNDKCPSGNFGDSSQLTNWILDSGATCHITPEVSYFIPV